MRAVLLSNKRETWRLHHLPAEIRPLSPRLQCNRARNGESSKAEKNSIKQEVHICSFCATFYNQSPGKSKTSSNIWSMTIDFYLIVSTLFSLRDSWIQNIYGWLYSSLSPLLLCCSVLKCRACETSEYIWERYKMWCNHVKLWGEKSSSHAAIIK